MRIRTACWIAVSICVRLLIAPSLSEAATITVPAGSNLQTALNLAQPGDVIMLAPGATYVGNFILPNKGPLSDYITIRSAAPDATLPAPGVRMTPSYAAQLPKIRSSNNMSALRTAAAANHWKLLFLEFQANVKGYGDIIALGAGDSTQTMLSQVPYAIVIDRVYVHGDPVTGCLAHESGSHLGLAAVADADEQHRRRAHRVAPSAGATPSSSSRPRTRVSISSRIGRTASTPLPAGSVSCQSR